MAAPRATAGILLLLAPLFIPGCAATNDRTPAIAIIHVNVLPMDSDGVLRNQTVVITDGVISEIGPAATTTLRPGTRRIDGKGGYLIPGLIDSHVHLRDSSELLSYLAFGVTSVVHLSGSRPDGFDVLDVRKRISSGEFPGPTIYTTGLIVDGEPPINPAVSVAVRTEEEARRVVSAQIDAGADFIKVYNNLSAGPLRAAITAAHDRGVAVFGHIPRVDGRTSALQRALEAGLDVIAHGEEYFFTFFYSDVERQLDIGSVPVIDDTRIPEAVRLTKDAGTAVIPNLSFIAMTRRQLDDLPGVLGDPEFRFLSPHVQEAWRRSNPTHRSDLERFDRREQSKYPFVQKLTLALNQEGVPLLVGSDASAPGLFPGHSVHLELRELVKAGLTPRDALLAATRTPGQFIATHTKAPSFGTISRGSRADMVLVRGNPLEDIENINSVEGVMARGGWFTREELQQLRARGSSTRAGTPRLSPP